MSGSKETNTLVRPWRDINQNIYDSMMKINCKERRPFLVILRCYKGKYSCKNNSVIIYYCTNTKGKDLKNAEVQKTLDSLDMHCINKQNKQKKQTFLNILLYSAES